MTPQAHKRVLLVQTGFLGDVILSTPVISALKSIYPNAEVWMMTTPAALPLVKSHPNLTGVITYDKRGKDRGLVGIFSKAKEIRDLDFAVVYSLHKSYRTALLLKLAKIEKRVGFESAALSFLYTDRVVREKHHHDVLRNLLILTGEKKLSELDSTLHLQGANRESWSKRLSEVISKERPYVVLVPGSVWATKRWFSDGYREVARSLSEEGVRVILSGSPSEQELCRSIGSGLKVTNLCGELPLEEFLSLVEHSSLLICNDSMALHVGSAFKTPTVAIFCATSPSFGFGPWQNRAIVLEKEGLSCKPCAPHGGNRCPIGTESCMRELSADVVVRAARTLLKSGG